MVLDCRNAYESDVGKFEGALPLGTNTFRDTWGALERVLGGKDPSKTQVMIYCTGGIRCVKVGAYLKQRMGFSRVARLQGGVVSYVRELKEQAQSDEAKFQRQSLFRGINYVFDNRIGELVTPDLPLQALPSETGPEHLVSDDDGRVLKVPAGPELRGDMERCRKVRECIGVAVEQLRSQATESSARAHEKLVSLLGPGTHDLASPSWASAPSDAFPTHVDATAPPVTEEHSHDDRQQRISLLNVRANGDTAEGDARAEVDATIEAFCEQFSRGLLAEEALLEELQAETRIRFPQAAHMTSGADVQGSLSCMHQRGRGPCLHVTSDECAVACLCLSAASALLSGVPINVYICACQCVLVCCVCNCVHMCVPLCKCVHLAMCVCHMV